MEWLSDVLDAPIKNILVVVGLACIIASILGQLGPPWLSLPKKWQRYIAAAMGAFFLFLGITLERFPTSSLPPTDPSAPRVSKPPPEPTPDPDPVNGPVSGEPAELEYLTISFPICTRLPSDIVNCDFFVKPRQSLWLFLRCQYSSGVSKAFDPIGGDHNCSRVQLGNRTDDRNIYQVLPSTNVRPKAAISFRSIPPDIDQISALQIYYNVKLGTNWSGNPSASADYTFDNVAIVNE